MRGPPLRGAPCQLERSPIPTAVQVALSTHARKQSRTSTHFQITRRADLQRRQSALLRQKHGGGNSALRCDGCGLRRLLLQGEGGANMPREQRIAMW